MDVLHGFEIGQKLEEAGLIPKNVRRIVIDIVCNEVVKVYYECFGDGKLIALTIEELIKNKDRLEVISVKDIEEPKEPEIDKGKH